MTPWRQEGLRNTASHPRRRAPFISSCPGEAAKNVNSQVSNLDPLSHKLHATARISVFLFTGASHKMKLENQCAGELQILLLKVNVLRAGDGSVGEALAEQALTT